MKIKKILIKLFPENCFKLLYTIENFIYKLFFLFRNDLIYKDSFGLKHILKSKDRRPMRWLLRNTYCQKEFLALKKLIKEGDTFVDVGANIGQVSIFARSLNKTGSIFAIEPNKNILNEIILNCALNNAQDVTIINCGVSNKNSFEKFYTYGGNSEVSSLARIDLFGVGAECVVEIKTLEKICEEQSVSKINFLKIDTEGYELEVLQGVENMLNKGLIDKIQFEIAPVILESRKINPEHVFDFIKKHGYKVYDFNMEDNTFIEIDKPGNYLDNYYASKNII